MTVASVATYVANQCTAYVASVLGWVPGGLGNAGDWAHNAASKGYAVGHTPAVGDVAVWAPGVAGAASSGHVAVVTAVGPNGLTISEENWPEGAGPRTRAVPSKYVSDLSYIAPPHPVGGAGGGGSNTALDVAAQLATAVGAPAISNPVAAATSAAEAIANLPATIAKAAGDGLVTVAGGVSTSLGHGLANAVLAVAHGLAAFGQRSLVALAVAAAVLGVMFL